MHVYIQVAITKSQLVYIHSQENSSYAFSDNNPPPRVVSILISITIDQFFTILELHSNENIHYVLIYAWLLSLNTDVLRFINFVEHISSLIHSSFGRYLDCCSFCL